MPSSETVTHVATEATGIDWRPVFNDLEADLDEGPVNAAHVKNVRTARPKCPTLPRRPDYGSASCCAGVSA
jgi:hypothetical protein